VKDWKGKAIKSIAPSYEIQAAHSPKSDDELGTGVTELTQAPSFSRIGEFTCITVGIDQCLVLKHWKKHWAG
jgi:hypothetical protein